jgi:hypothetical protein
LINYLADIDPATMAAVAEVLTLFLDLPVRRDPP